MNSLFDPTAFSVNAILQNSLHATAIIAVVLLLQSVLGRKLSPRFRYAMWGVVLIRLLVPWSIELPLIPQSTEAVLAPTNSIAQTISSIEHPIETQVPITESIARDTIVNTASNAIAMSYQNLLTIIWVSGLVLVPSLLLFNHFRATQRALRSAKTPSPEVLRSFDAIRSEMGLHVWPTVLESSEVRMPMLLGALRPKILLPTALVRNLTPEELRLILAHELNHLRSGDIWFGWLWFIALSVHWFNPLVWWVGARVRREREFACDESLVNRLGSGVTSNYADAILKAAASVEGTTTSKLRPGMASIAEDESLVRQRIKSVLHIQKRGLQSRIAGVGLTLALALTSFTWIGTVVPIAVAQEAPTDEHVYANEDLMTYVAKRMQEIEGHAKANNVWKDKNDLVNGNDPLVKLQMATPAERESAIEDLSAYAEKHSDNPDYGWRIWQLKSAIVKGLDENLAPGKEPRAITYMRQSIAAYPKVKYPTPRMHSKFQHLANETAFLIWDHQGREAAEEFIIDLWQNDRRFEFFFDPPWRQRMAENDVEALIRSMGEKAPLSKIEFVLTPKGLELDGEPLTSPTDIEAALNKIEDPRDHYIAMSVSSDEVSIGSHRNALALLADLVAKLGFDHLSDIGAHKP